MNRFLDRLDDKSSKAAAVGGGAAVVVLAVQVFTSQDPVGRCLRFWKQLAAHVSCLEAFLQLACVSLELFLKKKNVFH